jgi:hypothetical protein
VLVSHLVIRVVVEQVGTNGTRHLICEGAYILLIVTSDSLVSGDMGA